MRHAQVIEALNAVFALAHEITEDTVHAMASGDKADQTRKIDELMDVLARSAR